MGRRAEFKRARKAFQPGTLVTWGMGAASHLVVETRATGVVVDVTGHPHAECFAKRTPDGRLLLFVSFDRNNRNRSGRGPVRKA